MASLNFRREFTKSSGKESVTLTIKVESGEWIQYEYYRIRNF